LDIFKTHFAEDTEVLYKNDGAGNFDDRTLQAKLGVEIRFTSWGAGIFDLDNDGWPDIFFVTGGVYPEVEKKLPQYPDKSLAFSLETWGTAPLKRSPMPVRASRRRTQAVAAPSAISTTTAIWIF
jgi:enediyne biosynthesis protein E4